MINPDMKTYKVYPLILNDLGQFIEAQEAKAAIKIAVYPTSQAVQNNVAYLNAAYIGFTANTESLENCILENEEDKERLKVLYIASKPQERVKRLFLQKV